MMHCGVLPAKWEQTHRLYSGCAVLAARPAGDTVASVPTAHVIPAAVLLLVVVLLLPPLLGAERVGGRMRRLCKQRVAVAPSAC